MFYSLIGLLFGFFFPQLLTYLFNMEYESHGYIRMPTGWFFVHAIIFLLSMGIGIGLDFGKIL